MAERRMFAKTIIDSDAFLDMPLSTQCLYFHLNMRADDDGFINNPKKIQRMIGASDDDFKVLISKNFIIPFENGIVVIKHWKIHNYIRNDRYKETVYQEEKALLHEKENKAYSLEMTPGIPDGYQMDTQVRLGKDSIGKDNNIYGHSDQENQPDYKVKFEEFYNRYPRKVKKKEVEKWFKKNKPSNELFSSMMNSLEQFRASRDWQKDGGQFIPYPSTWLNQERWKDELLEPEKKESALDKFKREMEEKEKKGNAV